MVTHSHKSPWAVVIDLLRLELSQSQRMMSPRNCRQYWQLSLGASEHWLSVSWTLSRSVMVMISGRIRMRSYAEVNKEWMVWRGRAWTNRGGLKRHYAQIPIYHASGEIATWQKVSTLGQNWVVCGSEQDGLPLGYHSPSTFQLPSSEHIKFPHSASCFLSYLPIYQHVNVYWHTFILFGPRRRAQHRAQIHHDLRVSISPIQDQNKKAFTYLK